jgi:hypothetical protein
MIRALMYQHKCAKIITSNFAVSFSLLPLPSFSPSRIRFSSMLLANDTGFEEHLIPMAESSTWISIEVSGFGQKNTVWGDLGSRVKRSDVGLIILPHSLQLLSLVFSTTSIPRDHRFSTSSIGLNRPRADPTVCAFSMQQRGSWRSSLQRKRFHRTPSYLTRGARQPDEVKLQDSSDPNVKEKPGYQKIDYCCKQTLADDLQWVWVDT